MVKWNNLNINYKRLSAIFISLVLLIALAQMSLKGAGLPTTGRSITLFVMAVIVLNMSRKAYWLVAFPLIICYALYLPIGTSFGPPNYQYFASMMATDGNEVFEFLKQISIKYYTKTILIVLMAIWFRLLSTKFDLRFAENKTVMIFLVLFALAPQAPIEHVRNIYNALEKVQEETTYLRKLQNKNAWNVVEARPQFHNYVLVIGESARKDYHHLYGYPIVNTPFLSQTPGVVVDGLTAAGSNTIASLRLMLTMPDTQTWEPRYEYNFVDLANAAGFESYWISNQGFFGKADTPITHIAQMSQHRHFLKMGRYKSKNTDDDLLLPLFDKVLAEPIEGPKLIVLHLYGSHFDVCDRLHNFQPAERVKDFRYKNIACYVTSIRKTDSFLQKIVEKLQQQEQSNQRKFSMIYFSDHGQAHRFQDDNIQFYHGETRASYHIPLIKIDSYDHSQMRIKHHKSGLNFTRGLADWMGLTVKEIDHQYSLFSAEDDDDYGLSKKMEHYIEDSAIDIRGL